MFPIRSKDHKLIDSPRNRVKLRVGAWVAGGLDYY